MIIGCLHAQQPRGLLVHVGDVPLAIDGIHAFDDAAQHGLRLGLALAQRAGEVHQVAAHVVHRARQLADFRRTTLRNGRGEIPLAQLFGCGGKGFGGARDAPAQQHADDQRHGAEEGGEQQQAQAQRAHVPIDLRGRQPRFDEHDALAGAGEHRIAGRVQPQFGDMRDRKTAIGQRRGVQRGEFIGGRIVEVAVAAQPDLHAVLRGETRREGCHSICARPSRARPGPTRSSGWPHPG
jgi:hypothetical protein